MIEFTIKTLESINHQFCVEDETTVAQLKEQIRQEMGIEIGMQRLIFCGRVLTDDHKLSEYNVNGKVIHLVARPPPQPRSSPSASRRRMRETIEEAQRVIDRMSFQPRPHIRHLWSLDSSPDLVSELHDMTMLTPVSSRLEFIRRTLDDIRATLGALNDFISNGNSSGDAATQQPEPMETETSAATETLSAGTVPVTEKPSTESPSTEKPLAERPSTEKAPAESATTETPQIETSSTEIPPAARPEGPDADNIEIAFIRPRVRQTRPSQPALTLPRDLAQLVVELDRLQEQFAPFRNTYLNILRNSQGERLPPEQRAFHQHITDLVCDVMHSFAHAYHAISDINVTVGERFPRISTGFTTTRPQNHAPVQAHINLVHTGRRPTGATGSNRDARQTTPNRGTRATQGLTPLATAFRAQHRAALAAAAVARSARSTGPASTAAQAGPGSTTTTGTRGERPNTFHSTTGTDTTRAAHNYPEPITYQVEIETRVPIALPIDTAFFNELAAVATNLQQGQNLSNQQNQAGQQEPRQESRGQVQGQGQSQARNESQAQQEQDQASAQTNRPRVLMDIENLLRTLTQAHPGVEVMMSMEEIHPLGSSSDTSPTEYSATIYGTVGPNAATNTGSNVESRPVPNTGANAASNAGTGTSPNAGTGARPNAGTGTGPTNVPAGTRLGTFYFHGMEPLPASESTRRRFWSSASPGSWTSYSPGSNSLPTNPRTASGTASVPPTAGTGSGPGAEAGTGRGAGPRPTSRPAAGAGARPAWGPATGATQFPTFIRGVRPLASFTSDGTLLASSGNFRPAGSSAAIQPDREVYITPLDPNMTGEMIQQMFTMLRQPPSTSAPSTGSATAPSNNTTNQTDTTSASARTTATDRPNTAPASGPARSNNNASNFHPENASDGAYGLGPGQAFPNVLHLENVTVSEMGPLTAMARAHTIQQAEQRIREERLNNPHIFNHELNSRHEGSSSTLTQRLALSCLVYDRFLNCDSVHAHSRLVERRNAYQDMYDANLRHRVARATPPDIDRLEERNLGFTLRHMAIMMRLLSGPICPAARLNAFMVTVARVLFLEPNARPRAYDPIDVPREFQSVRMHMRDYFHGVIEIVINDGAVNNQFDRIISVLIEQNWNFLIHMQRNAEIDHSRDVMPALRSWLYERIPTILACLLIDSTSELFVARFYTIFHQFFVDICAFFQQFCLNGFVGLRNLYTQFFDQLTDNFEATSRGWLRLIAAQNLAAIEGVISQVNPTDDAAQGGSDSDVCCLYGAGLRSPSFRLTLVQVLTLPHTCEEHQRFVRLVPSPPPPPPPPPPPQPRNESPDTIESLPSMSIPTLSSSSDTSESPQPPDAEENEPNASNAASLPLDEDENVFSGTDTVSTVSHSSTRVPAEMRSVGTSPRRDAPPVTAERNEQKDVNKENRQAGAASAAPAGPQESAASHSPESMQFVPPVMILEHWGEEWVPVFTRDQRVQRERDRSQEPYSDAYLSGMPSRKRRCVRASRPPATLDGIINETVREATERSASLDPAHIRSVLRESVRSMVRTRAENSEDYDPARFTATARFLDQAKNVQESEPKTEKME